MSRKSALRNSQLIHDKLISKRHKQVRREARLWRRETKTQVTQPKDIMTNRIIK